MESIAVESTTTQIGLELLSLKELEARLKQYSSDERVALSQFLLHLSEVDRRKLYCVATGKETLWGYVHGTLGFPTCQTFLRTNAAKVVGSYPEVIDRILDGRLNLTSLAMLKSTVLPDGQGRLAADAALGIFDKASNLSTRELRRFLASLRAPTSRPPDGFRDAALPIATVIPASDLALREDADQHVTAVLSEDGKTTYVSVLPGKSVLITGIDPLNQIVPLANGQREFAATVVGDEFENDLAELAFLSHHDPSDYIGLIQRAVKREIRRLKKKKGLDPSEPILAKQKEAKAAAASEAPIDPQTGAIDLKNRELTKVVLAEISARLGRIHIPVALQAEVLRRANFCCEGIGEDGLRCCSTRRCQFDHRKPLAIGGKTTRDNLQVLCERCNLVAARRILGDEWVDTCIARDRESRAARSRVKSGLRAHEVKEQVAAA